MSIVSAIRRRRKSKQEPLNRYPWTDTDGPYFETIRQVARRQLLSAAAPPQRRQWLSRRNGGSQRPRDPNSWPNACLALGLVTAYRLFRDVRDLDVVTRFLDAIIDPHGALRRPLQQVDQCMIGFALSETHEHSQEPRYRQASDAIAQFLLEVHPKTESGTLPYTSRIPSLVLVDTLAMVCPFLADYGTRFAVLEATALAVAQLDEFLDHGLSAKTGLPYHGFQLGGPEELGIAGWARGTGWLAVALADTFASLAPEHPARPRLAKAFRDLADAVKPFQTEQGVWRWAVSVPEGAVDTSGTGLIGYAIERAVAAGILDADWTDVSQQALTAIVRLTRQDGLVDRANAECLGVGLHPAKSGPAPWAQGPAVALAALVFDRQRT